VHSPKVEVTPTRNARYFSPNQQKLAKQKLPTASSCVNGYYSKQYVNELKLIYDKEKEELIHKNQAMSNNLERLKTTLNDQVYLLQKELNEAKVKANNEIKKIIEERDHYLTRFTEAYRDKEEKLREANKVLTAENIKLNEINEKLENSSSSMNEKQESRIRDLESALEQKTRELMETSSNLKRQNEDQRKIFNSDVDGLVERYENTIQKMNLEYDKEQSNKHNQLERKGEKIIELESTLSRNEAVFQDALMDKNGIIEQLKADKFMLQKDLDSLRASKSNLSNKLESLERTESEVRNNFNMKNKDHEYLIAEQHKLKHELNIVKEKDKLNSAEIVKLKNLCDNYQRNSDAQVNELLQIQEAYDTLKKSNNVLSTHCKGLEKNIENHQYTINNLQKDNQMSLVNNDDLQTANIQIGSSNDLLKNENIRFQRELEVVDLERERLKIENANIKEEIKYLNHELGKLKSDSETNRVISSQQNNTLLKMKDDMTKIYNENSFLKNENSNLKCRLGVYA